MSLEHRVSNAQMAELLQYLMEHPSLVKGGLGTRSRDKFNREWNNLASKLNAHGFGATKTGQRWKRYWADLKFKVKTKVAARRREASSTDGGPATLDDLSETDQKVLMIIGEGAVYGDTQHREPIFLSSTEHSTESSNPPYIESTTTLKVNEIEASVTDYQDEVIIKTSDSPPPSVPISFRIISPSTRGHTSTVNAAEATAPAPDSPDRPPTTSRRINDATITRRPLRQARRSSSFITRVERTDQRERERVEPSWVLDLESRRVDAESRLAHAAVITAEAARSQAEGARVQAEASRMQAEASRMQAEATRMQAEALRDHAATLNKLIDMLSRK